MSRDELISIVSHIVAANGTDEKLNALVAQFESATKHPAGADLIFWPDLVPGTSSEPSVEEIVDTALSYEPVLLDDDAKAALLDDYLNHVRDDSNPELRFRMVDNFPEFDPDAIALHGRLNGLTGPELLDAISAGLVSRSL